MAKRGPKRTPTPALTSWRAKERAGEVDVPTGVPECPEALDATGRAKWRALVVLLGDVGILTLIDSDVLEVYCETYSRWRQACAEVRKSGAWHLTQQGLCETPASRIAKVLGAELRQLCGELGLSPASRAGLKVTAPKGKGNALSAFTA